MTVTPAGIAQRPAHSIFPSRRTTVASATGAAPVPSTSVAPTMTRGGGGVPGIAGKALVIAIFQPASVPVCSSEAYRTRYRYVP